MNATASTPTDYPLPESGGGWRKLDDPAQARALAGIDVEALTPAREWNRQHDAPSSVAEAEILIACTSLTEIGRRLRDLGAPETLVQETLANYQLLCTEVAPVDAATALTAFAIGRRTPRRLPLADALIAAVAQAKGAVLVHRDAHMRVISPELLQLNDLEAAS